MAWNQPGGGSGDKDPWGNRNQDQGPPDLDEIFKKLSKKFSGLFGGKGGSSSRTPSAGGGLFGMGFILLALLVIWGLSGFYIIKEGKQGVVLQFGAFNKLTEPGFHWYPRFIQSLEVVDVEGIRAVHVGQGSTEALMLTKDQNIVDMEFVVQYRVHDARKFLFAARDPEVSLQHAIQSAVRELAGNHTMAYITSEGREQMATLAKDRIQEIVNIYDTGLEVIGFNMQPAKPPREVQSAYDDVLAAEEDRNRYINEAKAYRNDILPKAKGQKQRMLEDAEGYKQEVISRAKGEADRFLKVLAEYEKAPRVTRERMYIDAMEQIYANSRKVMVDVKKGNNLMYLPLDRLGTRDTVPTTPSESMLPKNSTSIQGETLMDLGTERDRERSRSREVR